MEIQETLDFMYSSYVLKTNGLYYGLEPREMMSLMLGQLTSDNHQYQANIFSEILAGVGGYDGLY